MSQIAEVRFDVDPHDLTPEQIEGILKAHDGTLDIDVGLGYNGKAAVTFDVPRSTSGEDFAGQVAETARGLGLTVTEVEVLSEEEYSTRAWAEVEVDPNG